MKWLLIAMLVASTADMATTEIALNHGLVELNPFMRNRAVRVTSKMAAPFLIYYITRDVPRKYRVILCLGVTATWSALAGYNIGVIVKW